jgi:hypothetical protein
MNKLFEKYGHCIIPKNTILFRGFNDESYDDCMFFGTKYFVAKAFGNNVQVWRTKKAMKVLFLVKHLNNKGWVISGLPELYKVAFPNENNNSITDLDIKQDINRRKPFVQRLLQDYKINGWFSSVEDKIEVEICLFNSDSMKENIELIEPCTNQDSKYFEDSLRKIRIYPSELFYSLTQQNLENTYLDYKKSIQKWIRKEAKTDKEKENLRHYLFDLRLKLKL